MTEVATPSQEPPRKEVELAKIQTFSLLALTLTGVLSWDSDLFFHAIQDWRSLRDPQRCRGFHLFLHTGGLNMQASRTCWSRSGSLERKAHPRIWPKTAAK